jgi:Cu/Ag efflux protein CusF
MRLLPAMLFATIASLPAAALACDDHDHATPKKKRTVGSESAWIAGEVHDVDRTDGTITLRHARIDAFQMDAMASMVFTALNTNVLANTNPGDKVRFRARLINGQPTVTRILAAKP